MQSDLECTTIQSQIKYDKGVNMNSKSISMPHECPNCGKTASTHQEVSKEFGFRNIKGKEIRIQSYCKGCRKLGIKNNQD